ncbi:MAG: type VI secretion system protein TssL [Gammaproteobacteria bacterium HGW-Gammaproteobacteria-3]|nr:MAG: type VI secretion system protein TssL [Gammaproteobacteria bacterium HGW-Gammaproteobacteria-3]
MADDCPKCPPAGAPMWLATFADLMSLLMTFFVLLLSFATMDAVKFKKMADSMANAFGVQKEVPAYDIPMGTSIIAQHFSPAPTEPTPLEEVKQTTPQNAPTLAEQIDANDLEAVKKKLLEDLLKEIEEQANKIRESLKEEIAAGLVSVDTVNLKIVIRINESGSFPSGSAVLKAGFEPVMEKITASVNEAKGKVHVAGHSDDIPIATQMYRSNWELSASRAVTVAQFMFQSPDTDTERFVIEGYADTQPLVPNTSIENRAKNRRVEIVLIQDDPRVKLENQEMVLESKNEDKTE